MAKDAGMLDVCIATNAMLLRGNTAALLLDSGLDSLIVSVDSLDPDTYATIRIGGNLATVERNVRAFMGMRATAAQTRPQVDVRMIEMPENVTEKDAFRAHWSNVVDAVTFQALHNWGGD